jgi:lipopolysaccharide export system protein LptA
METGMMPARQSVHIGAPRRRRHAVALLVLALLVPASAAALSTDSEEPIRLNANRAEMDNTTGVSVYTGDVVMTQGTTRVTGDIMRVYTDDRRRIQRIEVEGSPATYRQRPDGETEQVRARAPRMEYYASGPERIRLLEGATLWQGRNEFKGRTIVYHVDSESVQADSGGQGNERIEITIFPNRGENTGSDNGGEGSDAGR